MKCKELRLLAAAKVCILKFFCRSQQIRDSIVVSIPACHAGDRGSIPRHGELLFPELEISCSWESIDLTEFYCWA